MSNNDTVCAVVVTFNRKELLIECLESLVNQSKPLDAIYIIDNYSSDNTDQLLLEKGYISKLPPKEVSEPWENDTIFNLDNSTSHDINIYYVRMNQNTGGAGGFYEGQYRAYNKGYKWLWLMDDDGYASDDCLEILLKETIKSNLLALNPLVINRDEHSKLSFGLDNDINLYVEAMSNANSSGLIMEKANPFNGTLLNSEIMKSCGFIKKEMFIWGDETEYFLRLKNKGFSYATAVNAKFYHPETKSVNSSVLFGLISVPIKPKILEMNYYRNVGYINGKYGIKSKTKFLLKFFVYHLLKGQLKKYKLLVQYFYDGRKNKFELPNLL